MGYIDNLILQLFWWCVFCITVDVIVVIGFMIHAAQGRRHAATI